MTIKQLIRYRLAAQSLAPQNFSDPADAVEWMGAVQAQDYAGSLWALGIRCKAINETDVEKAIEDRRIIRSWPMRGTLHFTAPQYIRWMLKHLTPRVISRAASIYRQAGLNEKVFLKSAGLLTKALEGNRQLTRNEMYDVLEEGKVSTEGYRGLHILGYLAQQGLICLSARRGKQPTFALLEEWVEPFPIPPADEAYATLCRLYFRSHGPATVADFMWWSGLTKKEADLAIADNSATLSHEKLGDEHFYFVETADSKKIPRVILIPAFDEYTVAYKDRTAVADPAAFKKSGYALSPCVIINGSVGGQWKRTLAKNHVDVHVTLFSKISPADKTALEKETKRYGKFVGLNPVLRR
ncbi:MAG TPA: winged helix DNA-binding domain-containing protein [Chryseosolibacter sp.]|nr:winged helix DNA-binding domain-containing protein [Chryseosolibacter sp.]